MLNPDRFLDPDPAIRTIARRLYQHAEGLPLVCPHSHVDPKLLAENRRFPDPSELIIIPDHYVFRMLYSQGIPLESFGIPRLDGGAVEQDRRKIWQLFGENYHLFRGTPTSKWLQHELHEVFGVTHPLNGRTALQIYDYIDERLSRPEFLPRALFERFNIEVLCTTDAATSSLEYHQVLRDSGWKGDVRPTFRPDSVVHLDHPNWRREIDILADLTGVSIHDYRSYLRALEVRREAFRELGATATDHAVLIPYTEALSDSEAGSLFARALRGGCSEDDIFRFNAHMLMEMARMSVEDGLVMQIHPGSFRNHNTKVFEAFGPDKGGDIPVPMEFTRNLRALLNRFGNDPRFRLVLFTLDESTYSRELAPLAGHYPALLLGPPWWFHDSREGMLRFRRRMTETAGIYNTAGFNDDTRAFPSIPARHDLSRRIDASFLAGLVAEHVIELDEAMELMGELAGQLARRAYRLDTPKVLLSLARREEESMPDIGDG